MTQEITKNLLPGQKAEDRPELADRVFKGYMDAMVKELYTTGILGKHVAHCHVIEFQVWAPNLPSPDFLEMCF